MQLEPSEIWALDKEHEPVEARSLLCYRVVRDIGITMTELPECLKPSLSVASLPVKRRKKRHTIIPANLSIAKPQN